VDHFFIELLGDPFALGLRDLLDDVVHLVTQTLNLLVPLRQDLASCERLG
jgi:hypothetical protein